MPILDKNAIMELSKLKTEAVAIGDGEVMVTEIGAADMVKLWAEENRENIDMASFATRLLLFSLVDENGQRLFADDELKIIERFPHTIFTKLVEASRRINGLNSDEEIKN